MAHAAADCARDILVIVGQVKRSLALVAVSEAVH
jgi:hypothetical protein